MVKERYHKKRMAKQAATATKEYSLKLTQQQWLVIFNTLLYNEDKSPRKWLLGDGQLVWTVVKAIEPLVVIDTNIPEDKQAEPESPAFEIETEPAPIGVHADGEDSKTN